MNLNPFQPQLLQTKEEDERKQNQQTPQDCKKTECSSACIFQSEAATVGTSRAGGKKIEYTGQWLWHHFSFLLYHVWCFYLQNIYVMLNFYPPRPLQYLVVPCLKVPSISYCSLFKSAPKLKYCFLVQLCLFIWNTVVLITRLYMYTVPESKKNQRIRRIKCLGPISVVCTHW